jgi:hypothetical protein
MKIDKTPVQIAQEVMQRGPANEDPEKVALACAILAISQNQGDDEVIASALAAHTDFSAVVNS